MSISYPQKIFEIKRSCHLLDDYLRLIQYELIQQCLLSLQQLCYYAIQYVLMGLIGIRFVKHIADSIPSENCCARIQSVKTITMLLMLLHLSAGLPFCSATQLSIRLFRAYLLTIVFDFTIGILPNSSLISISLAIFALTGCHLPTASPHDLYYLHP